MHQHAAFRLQLQQQLLQEGSQVQSEHPMQKPGLQGRQRCVMPANHQYEANDPCSCTASSKLLQGGSQQTRFSMAASSYLGPPPASGNAAHDTKGAADAEECGTASAAAQVRSIWTTADYCINLSCSALTRCCVHRAVYPAMVCSRGQHTITQPRELSQVITGL